MFSDLVGLIGVDTLRRRSVPDVSKRDTALKVGERRNWDFCTPQPAKRPKPMLASNYVPSVVNDEPRDVALWRRHLLDKLINAPRVIGSFSDTTNKFVNRHHFIAGYLTGGRVRLHHLIDIVR